MRRTLLNHLACPECRSALGLSEVSEQLGDQLDTGILSCLSCQRAFSIVRGIPRFVPSENYAQTFGFQWSRFRQTQLDSYTGVPISRQRFLSFTGWLPEDLRGKLVLDAGCGAGRFTEIALQSGAEVVAVDSSTAVDACWQNLGPHDRLHVVQADIYHLPFRAASFDFIYCLGVLQHTPDVERAFLALPAFLKSGGSLTVDIYPRLWKNIFWPKYWIRPFTKRLRPQVLFRFSEKLVNYLLPVSRAVGRIPLFGRKLRYLLPVVNYEGVYPLSKQRLREWSLLDTFDMLSPAHDHPQSANTLRRWLEQAGLKNIQVERKGFLIARGVK